MNTDLSVILVNYRTPALTRTAIDTVHTVLRQSPLAYEVLVVDNASGDESRALLEALPDVQYIQAQENLGFGRANNLAARRAKGRILFFLNSDTKLQPEVLPEMVAYLDAHEDVGAMTCLMRDGAENPIVTAHAFENTRTLFYQTVLKPLAPPPLQTLRARLKTQAKGPTACDWISGAGFLVPQKVFAAVNGFDPRYFMYMEDEDLCRRIRAEGYRILLYPRYGVQHLVSRSPGGSRTILERAKGQLLFFSETGATPRWLVRQLIILRARQDARHLPAAERRTVMEQIRKLPYA